MTTARLSRLAGTGLLAIVVAACGGGGSDTEPDVAAPVASTAVSDEVAANAPEDAGAVIYEEEVPVPGTTLGACEIVTADDVKAAFMAEGTVAAGTFEADPTTLSPNHSECTYEGDFGRLIVSLTPEDGANLYDAAYGAYDEVEPITGIGDGAFWSAPGRRGFVWQEKVTAVFTIFPASADLGGLEITTALGQAVVEKL